LPAAVAGALTSLPHVQRNSIAMPRALALRVVEIRLIAARSL
jgi:hypothetical protein